MITVRAGRCLNSGSLMLCFCSNALTELAFSYCVERAPDVNMVYNVHRNHKAY